MSRLTTAQINEAKSVNLLNLIGAETELRRIAVHELAGPCPFCGGNDRFHVQLQSHRWFCRQCTGEPAVGGWQDAIDYVRRRQGVGFRQAVSWLTAGKMTDGTNRVQSIQSPKKRAAWQLPTWQSRALAAVARAQTMLDADAGISGRQYLLWRAIEPVTWRAWALGFAHVPHPVRHVPLPAITLPWPHRHGFSAIQYRFIQDDLQSHERFGQRRGGERLLFGLPRLRGRDALILVEGELNALSLWQVCGEAVDVLSWGPQGNLLRPAVLEALHPVLQNYPRLLLWADDAAISSRYLQRLQPMAMALRSAQALHSPHGLDANSLLQQGDR